MHMHAPLHIRICVLGAPGTFLGLTPTMSRRPVKQTPIAHLAKNEANKEIKKGDMPRKSTSDHSIILVHY